MENTLISQNENPNNNIEDTKKRDKISKIIAKSSTYIILVIGGIVVLLPFLWMIMNSFKTNTAYTLEETPSFIPKVFTLANYKTIWDLVPLAIYTSNSLIYSVVTTTIMVFAVILAAFAFARLNFYGKNILFTIYLATMMIPMELFTITNYVTICSIKVNGADLRDTFVGLIFPSVISVFYVYLLRQNFMQCPDQIYYAAKVDGCSDLKYLFRVLVPLSKPTVISIIVLKFIECWNAYAWPHLITQDQNKMMISQGIEVAASETFGSGRTNVPAEMAMVTLATIPLLVIFFVFRKQIMSGVSKSGLKG